MITDPTTDRLRASFVGFFAERDHIRVPSSPLIPSHEAAPLFTNAGMIQFLPYFFGEESPPWLRATSAQKCLRVRGKHDDIEAIGRTTRHLTFFEMLGNFSFGNYFKEGAIEYAWGYLTEVLGLEPDRLWATVHETDDEAETLWREIVDLPPERIQRLGEDNFWEMGATGPCGPSSEIFYDKGPEFGEEGGPAHGGEERYVEIWNLVFMTFNRLDDGSLVPLHAKNIDTGAGIERILPIIQGKSSVFETDVLRRLVESAERLTGARYGRDADDDVSLRIVADHSRAVTFAVADGAVPSNEERGYVIRRILRRAVRHAQRLGATKPVLPGMAEAVAATMGHEYGEISASLDGICDLLEREEERFGDTLRVGLGMLDDALVAGAETVSGDLAFKLHDTFGFPVELTREVAAERGISVDEAGFELAMARQRELARAGQARKEAPGDTRFRTLAEDLGPSRFVGYDLLEHDARVTEVVPNGDGAVEVFVEATPFYAESGGQIGDTGSISTETGRGRVVDTDAPAPGLTRHLVTVEEGSFAPGQTAHLEVDAERRSALRRSHTATHLLHWALRSVLGPQTHQQGSLVAPDYLRFDFNHHAALTDDQLREIEDLVVDQILSDSPVETNEMPLEEARRTGAMSFFGEKYGDVVRVVQAGANSTELCGGTHVGSLGQIGEFFIRSEASVGANLRRIEAVTGQAAHEDNRRQRALVHSAAAALKVPPDDLLDAIRRTQKAAQQGQQAYRQLLARMDRHVAADLAASAEEGVVIARVDGRDQEGLRALALQVRERPGVRAAGLIGAAEGGSVALAVALEDETSGLRAPDLIRQAAKLVGGGGGGKDPLLAVGGGRDPSRIDEALDLLRGRMKGAGPA